MSEISASTVMELRKATGAGLMDCKKALAETNGDFDKAVEFLQVKKKATAAKKVGRIAAEGAVASYVHMGGKIGVLCEVNCETDFAARSDQFQEFVKDVCLHIAAMAPQFVSEDEVPAEVVEKQKELFIAQVVEEGKPQALAEKIVTGKVSKWLKDICLLEQKFVKNPDQSVKDLMQVTSGEIGERISIRRFVRYELGEGLAKRSENFADEVAAAMGG